MILTNSLKVLIFRKCTDMNKIALTNILINSSAVFFGGALGGLIRFSFTQIPVIGASTIVIMVINILGSFSLAFFAEKYSSVSAKAVVIKSFIGTGIIGGFTTFSTMILQTANLAKKSFVLSLLYLFTSLVLSLLLVRAGGKMGSTK